MAPRAPPELPHNPVGAMCDFLFFNPLEDEFESCFYKNVGLAMLYHKHFEKLKKKKFSAFYGNFCSVGAWNNLVEARTFSRSDFRGLFFNL